MADKGQSKALKSKFANKASTYSKYSEMVYSAITSLKERKGSTRKTILKYILATYDINEDVAYVQVKKALKTSVENGTLKQIQDKGENVYFKVNVSKNKCKQSNNTVEKGYSPKSLKSQLQVNGIRSDYEDYSLLKDQACELKQLGTMTFDPSISSENLSRKFIHTICGIQPLSIYRTNYEEQDFGSMAMGQIITKCSRGNKLQELISRDLLYQIKKRNKITADSMASKFLINCFQIIRELAVQADASSDPNRHFVEIFHCLVTLKEGLGSLINLGDNIPEKSEWTQFCHIITHPVYFNYVVEALVHITDAANNIQDKVRKKNVMSYRDSIVEDLKYVRICIFP